MSELIFQKVATEIEHILRLSRLKEYASPEQDFNWSSSQQNNVKDTLVPEVFLDFSSLALSRISHAGINQEKPPGPGYVKEYYRKLVFEIRHDTGI